MKAREFYELTKAMRAAQKKYFATMSREALKESKKLETALDAEINRVEQVLAKLPKETAEQQKLEL